MGVFLFAVVSLALSALCAEAVVEPSERKVVCYYTTWSFNRPTPYNFSPDKIDPFLCTHIIYAFADIGSKNNLISANPDFDFNQRGYANTTRLKVINKNLKVMIGIGGWAKGTLGFGRITANETNRKEFARNAVRFLRGYKFDGLDLNWQHPTFREGGTPEDRENYVLLAQTLREEFDKEAMLKSKPKLLLSIAISHNMNFLPAYDISSFNSYMDFISVICYDYHFSYESAVNHLAPLYSLEQDTNYDAKSNINYTIQYFSERANPEKLVLGIPTYGRTYKLDDPASTTLGSYADGPGEGGPITGEKGWYAYFEICNFVQNEGWTVMQTKPGSAGPYAYQGDQWVSYDDLDMIRNKVDFANDKNLGGVMFWTVDYDDFLGKCQNSKFPLIRAARDALIPPGVISATDKSEEAVGSEGPEPQPMIKTVEPAPNVVQPPVTNHDPIYEEEESGPPNLPSVPTATPKGGVSKERPQGTDVSVDPQSNILADLTRLIEKAVWFGSGADVKSRSRGLRDKPTDIKTHFLPLYGGVRNLAEIIRREKSQKRNYSPEMDNDNSLVLESQKLVPPLLLIMNNSSIYIKEFNIYKQP